MSARERYAAVLRTPDVARLLAAAVVARLPLGLDGLAIVLFVQSRTGSFADAGAVAGAFGIAAAVATPVQGRFVDRHGHARVLLPLAGGHALALGALVLLGLSGAHTAVLALCGVAAGATLPSVGGVVRPLLPRLLEGREDLLATAYALDSTLIEIAFVLGPLLAGLLVTVGAAWALVAACAFVLAGTVTLVTTPASRAWKPDPPAERHPLGPLVAPGVRTVLAVTFPISFCIGAVEVVLPAFATHEGSRGAAGLLLAAWSFGSGVGGLVYGARHQGHSLERTYVALAALFPLCVVPLLAGTSIVAMLPLALLAGLAIAPLFSAGNHLVGLVAPAGLLTEAFAWPVTALGLGIAGGNAVSGVVIDAAGWRTAVLTGLAVSLAGVTIAATFRATLAPRAARSSPAVAR